MIQVLGFNVKNPVLFKPNTNSYLCMLSVYAKRSVYNTKKYTRVCRNQHTKTRSEIQIQCLYVYLLARLLIVLYTDANDTYSIWIWIHQTPMINGVSHFGWFFCFSLTLYLFILSCSLLIFVRESFGTQKNILWMCCMRFSIVCTVWSSRAQFLLYCFIKFDTSIECATANSISLGSFSVLFHSDTFTYAATLQFSFCVNRIPCIHVLRISQLFLFSIFYILLILRKFCEHHFIVNIVLVSWENEIKKNLW